MFILVEVEQQKKNHENVLNPILEKYKFKIVFAEDLSYKDRVNLFLNAKTSNFSLIWLNEYNFSIKRNSYRTIQKTE